MKIYFIYPERTGFVDWCIRWVTGGDYSHIALLFEAEKMAEQSVLKHKAVIVESTIELGKDGLDGVRQVDFVQWKKENPHFVKQQLVMDQHDVTSAWGKAMLALGHRYARLQIARNWLQRRFDLGRMSKYRSREEWTCSETVARIVPVCWAKKVLKLGEYIFDEYTPSGTYGRQDNAGPGIYDLVERYQNEK